MAARIIHQILTLVGTCRGMSLQSFVISIMTDYLIEEIYEPLCPAQLSIRARGVLGSLLADRYGIRQLPVIATYPSGKPYFPTHPHIHFSLSHCSRAVMGAVSDTEVGCDIEDIQDAADITSELLQVAFSLAEQARILQSATPAVEMTRLWTRKEANMKRTGSIPDNPVNWLSEMPGVSTYTCCEAAKGYIYSISH